jgi:hypothetical protein
MTAAISLASDSSAMNQFVSSADIRYRGRWLTYCR